MTVLDYHDALVRLSGAQRRALLLTLDRTRNKRIADLTAYTDDELEELRNLLVEPEATPPEWPAAWAGQEAAAEVKQVSLDGDRERKAVTYEVGPRRVTVHLGPDETVDGCPRVTYSTRYDAARNVDVHVEVEDDGIVVPLDELLKLVLRRVPPERIAADLWNDREVRAAFVDRFVGDYYDGWTPVGSLDGDRERLLEGCQRRVLARRLDRLAGKLRDAEFYEKRWWAAYHAPATTAANAARPDWLPADAKQRLDRLLKEVQELVTLWDEPFTSEIVEDCPHVLADCINEIRAAHDALGPVRVLDHGVIVERLPDDPDLKVGSPRWEEARNHWRAKLVELLGLEALTAEVNPRGDGWVAEPSYTEQVSPGNNPTIYPLARTDETGTRVAPQIIRVANSPELRDLLLHFLNGVPPGPDLRTAGDEVPI